MTRVETQIVIHDTPEVVGYVVKCSACGHTSSHIRNGACAKCGGTQGLRAAAIRKHV